PVRPIKRAALGREELPYILRLSGRRERSLVRGSFPEVIHHCSSGHAVQAWREHSVQVHAVRRDGREGNGHLERIRRTGIGSHVATCRRVLSAWPGVLPRGAALAADLYPT